VIAAYDGNFPADMSTSSEEGSRRSDGCSMSRSPAHAVACTSTFRRYYYRPRGGDDAHGYGRASRFLTDDVQSLFTRTRPAIAATCPGGGHSRRIEVSVDALFS